MSDILSTVAFRKNTTCVLRVIPGWGRHWATNEVRVDPGPAEMSDCVITCIVFEGHDGLTDQTHCFYLSIVINWSRWHIHYLSLHLQLNTAPSRIVSHENSSRINSSIVVIRKHLYRFIISSRRLVCGVDSHIILSIVPHPQFQCHADDLNVIDWTYQNY